MTDDKGINQLTPRGLLEAWCERARLSSKVHYKIASRKLTWNGVLALGVVMASTFVGSAIFVMMDESLDDPWPWVLAVMSLLAALLAGLQRTLRLGEIGEGHRAAGARWDAIYNRICVVSTKYAGEVPHAELEKIESSMDDLVKESPHIPEGWFKNEGLDKTYPSCRGRTEKEVGGAS